MEAESLNNNETPEGTIYETFEIKKGDKTYILSVKSNSTNMIFGISEEKLFFEIYQTKLTLGEIKLLNKAFSIFSSCQEFLEYIKTKIKDKSLSIDRNNSNKINIHLEQDSILIELTKLNIKPDLITINMYEMMSKLKSNYKNIIKENKNIKDDIKKMDEENKKIKEENENILNENFKLKENNEIQKQNFAKMKKSINRLVVENINLKSEFNQLKLKENKEKKDLFEIKESLIQKINKLLKENKRNKLFKNESVDLFNKNKNIKDGNKILIKKNSDTLINQIKNKRILKDKNETLVVNNSNKSFKETIKNIKLVNKIEPIKLRDNPFIKQARPFHNIKKNKNHFSLDNLEYSPKIKNKNNINRKPNNFSLSFKKIKNENTLSFKNNYPVKKHIKPNIINRYNEGSKENFFSIFNLRKDIGNNSNNNNKNIFNESSRNKINNINVYNIGYNQNVFNSINNKKDFNTLNQKNFFDSKEILKNEFENKENDNTYIIATLQCFVNIEQLNKYFLSKENETKICKNRLSKEFLEIIKNINESENIKENILSNFKKLKDEMNSFKIIRDNNPKDLILFLIETMHNELNNVKKFNKHNEDKSNKYDINKYFENYEKYFIKNFQSIFSDLFYGIYDTQVKHINSGYIYNPISHKINYFNILIFSLEEIKKFKNIVLKETPITLNKCFEYYVRNESIIKNNLKTNIINNNKDENVISHKEILRTPKILIINLISKNESQINFLLEKEIIIRRFVHYKNYGYKYDLIGIISKQILTEKNGNYISFYKNYKNLKWYKCDNSVVAQSSFEEAKNIGGGYDILIYSKY